MRRFALLAVLTVACSDRDAVRIAELEAQVVQLRGELATAKLDQPVRYATVDCPPAPACTGAPVAAAYVPPAAAAPATPSAPAADCSAAFATAEAQIERYRSGLDRCVAQLNARQPAAPVRQAEAPRVYTSTPEVRLVGDTLTMSVRADNMSETEYRGSLQFDLLVDGRQMQSATESVIVPARGGVVVQHAFSALPSHGTYTGRVRVGPAN